MDTEFLVRLGREELHSLVVLLRLVGRCVNFDRRFIVLVDCICFIEDSLGFVHDCLLFFVEPLCTHLHLFFHNLRVNVVIEGLVCVTSRFLRRHPRSLLLGQSDAVAIWNLVLYAAVHGIIDYLVEVDESLHAALSLRLLQLFVLLFDRALKHIFVLLRVLLELLVESAHLLLDLLGLRRLELVDVSNKGILTATFRTLVRYSLFDDHLEIAVQEIEPRHIVPGLQCISREDNDLVFAEHFPELLVPLVDRRLAPLLFPAHR